MIVSQKGCHTHCQGKKQHLGKEGAKSMKLVIGLEAMIGRKRLVIFFLFFKRNIILVYGKAFKFSFTPFYGYYLKCDRGVCVMTAWVHFGLQPLSILAYHMFDRH